MNYYPFHIGDFRSGTANMSRTTRWIYRDMLDLYYDKESPLPLDHEKLFDELGVETEDERRIVERLLRFKFAQGEEGYRHAICDQVIAEYHAKAETARANGKKGGRPRNPGEPNSNQKGNPQKPSGNPAGSDPDASGTPAATGSKANQEPRTNNQGKPKPSSSAGADGEGGEPPEKVKPFDQFWAVYPRRVAKAEAQKAWTKLKLDGKVGEIVVAVLAQIDGHDFKRDNGEYIPHPATWLRAGRWLDEVRPYVTPAPKLPHGWWETPESIRAAGLTLDPPLEPRPGEGQKAFALRIRVAMGEVDMPTGQPRDYTMTPPPEKIERPYVPPAPAEGVELTKEQQEAREEERRQRQQEFRDAAAKLKQSGGLATAGVAAANDQAAA